MDFAFACHYIQAILLCPLVALKDQKARHRGWQCRIFASCAVQTPSALRTTNCWQHCRFAKQIHKLPCNITRSLYSCRHCLNAANSGKGGLAFHTRISTPKCTAQTSPILFPHLPPTMTVAHTVPVSFGFTTVRSKVSETYHCNGNVLSTSMIIFAKICKSINCRDFILLFPPCLLSPLRYESDFVGYEPVYHS